MDFCPPMYPVASNCPADIMYPNLNLSHTCPCSFLIPFARYICVCFWCSLRFCLFALKIFLIPFCKPRWSCEKIWWMLYLSAIDRWKRGFKWGLDGHFTRHFRFGSISEKIQKIMKNKNLTEASVNFGFSWFFINCWNWRQIEKGL